MAKRKDVIRSKRRAMRVRAGLNKGVHARVSVFRSAKHIYAQLIDDKAGTTIASASSLKGGYTGNKKEVAHAVGKALAEKAKEHGVTQALFDRGPFLYHGRVKELAQGLREAGLTV